MHLITKIVVSLTLLAVESLAATIAPHPAKAARWMAVPRTLQGINRGIIDDRDIEYLQPLRRNDLFTRQAGCSPTQVACEGNKCCPFGFTCYSTGDVIACCPVGETCSGPPIGCADPHSFECPAAIGGCCPNDQECYVDSQDVARCRGTIASSPSSGTLSTSASAIPIYGATSQREGGESSSSETLVTSVFAIPIYGTTSQREGGDSSSSETLVTSGLVIPTYAVPIYSSGPLAPGSSPTAAPTGGGSAIETGPRTTTTRNGVEKRMGLGLGVLLMPVVFTVLA